ncbi:MAG: hypothetical protein RIC35_03515 [Marinoscillum sp.]
MTKKLINLLQLQIDKLEAEDFDLEAWKSSTVSVLTRVFGEKDPRIKQINELKIDYSSWALRDSNSHYKPVETNKRKGKEILSTAISEVELFGLHVKMEAVLARHFDEGQIKILLSESGDKQKLVQQLKKKDLELLVLELINSNA